MKVTNISKALQGVNGKSGAVYIRPGESKDVEFDEAGEKQARRLKGILDLRKAKSDTRLKAEHHGGGKFNVTEGERVHLSGLSKADADAFNAMSDADKAAYVEAEKTKG